MTSAVDKACQIYIVGDFNINLHCNSKSYVNEFIQLLYVWCFYPIIIYPTRITSHSATLINNIFTNVPNCIFSSQIISDLSDHCPILSYFNCYPDSSPKTMHAVLPQDVPLRRDFRPKNLLIFGMFYHM